MVSIKHGLLSFVWVLLVLGRAAAQQSEPLITLHASMRAGDTACYRYQCHNYVIKQRDTLHTTLLVRDFSLVVSDENPTGSHLFFTLTAVHSRDDDNLDLTSLLANHVLSGLVGHTLSLRTDSSGRIVHIDDWRELSEHVKRTTQVMLDEVYRTESEKLRGLERDSVEHRLALLCDTEHHLIGNLLSELTTLFCMNGASFPLGWTRETYTKADSTHFESRLTVFADTLSPNPTGGDPYGGTVANFTLLELIPVARVIDGSAHQWQHLTTHALVMPLIERALDTGDAGTVKLTDDRMLSYFTNGWPKEFILTRRAALHSTRALRPVEQRLEQRYLIWTRMKTRRTHSAPANP